jgi:hypothetical protein
MSAEAKVAQRGGPVAGDGVLGGGEDDLAAADRGVRLRPRSPRALPHQMLAAMGQHCFCLAVTAFRAPGEVIMESVAARCPAHPADGSHRRNPPPLPRTTVDAEAAGLLKDLAEHIPRDLRPRRHRRRRHTPVHQCRHTTDKTMHIIGYVSSPGSEAAPSTFSGAQFPNRIGCDDSANKSDGLSSRPTSNLFDHQILPCEYI